ncbi:MAG: phosphate ABC transporter permease PstC, partial [Polynucleobacter victoriensis]
MNTSQSSDMLTPQAEKILKIQKLQDFAFHKSTLFFALLVLVALIGIIISLIINAWPALREFGLGFFFTVEWDI